MFLDCESPAAVHVMLKNNVQIYQRTRPRETHEQSYFPDTLNQVSGIYFIVQSPSEGPGGGYRKRDTTAHVSNCQKIRHDPKSRHILRKAQHISKLATHSNSTITKHDILLQSPTHSAWPSGMRKIAVTILASLFLPSSSHPTFLWFASRWRGGP